MRKFSILLASIVTIVVIIGTATALEEILDGFNAKYDTYKTKLDTCDTCHIYGKPKKASCEVCHVPDKPEKEITLNPYGMVIKDNLNVPISQALTVVETLDSDKDGSTNVDEIHNLTFPGSKNDKPKKNVAFVSSVKYDLNALKLKILKILRKNT